MGTLRAEPCEQIGPIGQISPISPIGRIGPIRSQRRWRGLQKGPFYATACPL